MVISTTARVARMPADMRSGRTLVAPPTYRPVASARSISRKVAGDITQSASMVTMTSPVATAAPALRTAEMLRASLSTTTAPASWASVTVASVQRFATTITSTPPELLAAAAAIAASPFDSSTSSLCAGTTTENRINMSVGPIERGMARPERS